MGCHSYVDPLVRLAKQVEALEGRLDEAALARLRNTHGKALNELRRQKQVVDSWLAQRLASGASV